MGTTQSSILGDENFVTADVQKLSEIKFNLQDVEHTVAMSDVTPSMSLNNYLRNDLKLTGTKAMCYEGGCGSCVVVLQKKDPITQKSSWLAVNSCLVPLLSCNSWNIYTIEGIGNPLEGYNLIQETLATFNGTQCGFCSPGMVMNMYALSASGKPTMSEVENSFSGNICRCTGYRSILSAFKSLAKDADPKLLGECPDMEDFVFCYKEKCERKCTPESTTSFYLQFEKAAWVKVHDLPTLLRTLKLHKNSSYRLVAGNTAQGVFASYKQEVDLYIDVNDVPELKVTTVAKDSCIVGGNVTLTNFMAFCTETAKSNGNFSYLKAVAEHVDLVANVPVRNRGTLAGNLTIKHDHHDFPSDIFLLLETVGATLTLVNTSGKETQTSPQEFLDTNMDHIVLKSVTFKAFPTTYKFISYKIMPRAQNTHAAVNAGFVFRFSNGSTCQSATIVYGNINPSFVHATQAEKFLAGKQLFDNTILQQTYQILAKEINPNIIPPDPSPEARKQLAIALFYKAVLAVAPADKVTPLNKSGGELLKRPISSGAQDYETNKSMYPVTEAIPKLEALAQTSGQAKYVIDMPDLPYQLYGALVLAAAPPNSTIKNIDPSKALNSPDIVAFYSKDDVIGENIFTTKMAFLGSEEELFCSGRVKYYDQTIGILVGKNKESVDQAISLVQVTYVPPNEEPLTSTRQVLKEGRTDRINKYKTVSASRKGTNIKHVVKGTFDIHQQYHFHMETQVCNVIPVEDGLEVHSSTQWMDLVQVNVARVLKLPQHKVNVKVRRCGGGFGGKISRAPLPACAAALASWKLRKPVKLWMSLPANMEVIGKRWPLSTDYEVGVDDKGIIQYLNVDHYTDVGYQFNEDITQFLETAFITTYASDTFTYNLNRVITDTPVNTWTRAPGTNEGVASIESIMEHISYAVGADPVDVRLANLAEQTVAKYINDLKSWANIDQRKADIATFNKQNRWKKKGLAVVPMCFEIFIMGPYTTTVSILHFDGSVQVSHGGTEVGQGINTKVAQVCAYKLGIPLDQVRVLPSNSFVSANSMTTGGSITSEAVCYAAIQACDTLLERMKPYQTQGAKWGDVIRNCYENNVNLIAIGLYTPTSPGIAEYVVYGICASEVIVDILTGQHIVNQVDLIEDTGNSMNPIVDIGQVEGAFILGLGYYTTERIVLNYEGRLLTNNTWTYFPPGAKDIPVKFNVKFPKNNPNPVGVLKSKAVGEPAVCLSVSIPFAIRNALASARKDAASSNTSWYPIDGPTDLQNIILNSLNNSSQFVI